MRVRYGIVAALAGVGVAIVVGVGCGSSDNGGGGSTADAAADVTADQSTPMDSAADTAMDAAPACMNDADLETLDAGNAPIGDSGATTDTCITCTKAACGPELTTCNGDCSCRQALTDLFGCLQTQGASPSCASGVLGNTNAQMLGQCVFLTCAAQCGFGAATDGGKQDGGDAATDAPSDAPDDGG